MEVVFKYRGEYRSLPLPENEAWVKNLKYFRTIRLGEDRFLYFPNKAIDSQVVDYIFGEIKDQPYFQEGCPIVNIAVLDGEIVRHCIASSKIDNETQKAIEDFYNQQEDPMKEKSLTQINNKNQSI